MIMKKEQIQGLAIVLFLVGIVLSCTTSPTAPPASVPVNLEITFKPSALTTLIDNVRLRIIYPATADTTVEFPTVNQGKILDTLALRPGEGVELYLTARSADAVLLYEGYDTVNVVAGGLVVSSIYMEPVVSLLRPSPLYREVSISSAEGAEIGIDIYNVSDVFGAAFRVFYDGSVAEVVDVLPGSFLGPDEFFFYTVEAGDGLSYVAIGITRTQNEGGTIGGVDGSGRLATIVFSGSAEGSFTLSFNTEKAVFTNPAGEPIAEYAQLVYETGEVVVIP